MKRKITRLESKLLNMGYVLESKEYCGKHKDFTKCYNYEKAECNYLFVIQVSKKRDSIVGYYFKTFNNDIDKEELDTLIKVFQRLCDDVLSCNY